MANKRKSSTAPSSSLFDEPSIASFLCQRKMVCIVTIHRSGFINHVHIIRMVRFQPSHTLAQYRVLSIKRCTGQFCHLQIFYSLNASVIFSCSLNATTRSIICASNGSMSASKSLEHSAFLAASPLHSTKTQISNGQQRQ